MAVRRERLVYHLSAHSQPCSAGRQGRQGRTNGPRKFPSDADSAKMRHQHGGPASVSLARAGGERGDKVIKAPALALRVRILRPNSLRSRVAAQRNRSDDWSTDLVFLELTTSDSLNSGLASSNSSANSLE